MAPNFKSLLNRPAGKAKKPEAIPAGDYLGVISNYEYGESSKKKTPYVRYIVKLTHWPDTVPEEDRFTTDAEGQRVAIDLSKKTYKVDYYITDDALYRLDDVLRAIGLDPMGRTYEEICPEAVGAHVIAAMVQETSDSGPEPVTYTVIQQLTGQA